LPFPSPHDFLCVVFPRFEIPPSGWTPHKSFDNALTVTFLLIQSIFLRRPFILGRAGTSAALTFLFPERFGETETKFRSSPLCGAHPLDSGLYNFGPSRQLCCSTPERFPCSVCFLFSIRTPLSSPPFFSPRQPLPFFYVVEGDRLLKDRPFSCGDRCSFFGFAGVPPSCQARSPFFSSKYRRLFLSRNCASAPLVLDGLPDSNKVASSFP